MRDECSGAQLREKKRAEAAAYLGEAQDWVDVKPPVPIDEQTDPATEGSSDERPQHPPSSRCSVM